MEKGRRIRVLRLTRGLTQTQLARELGVEPVTISRWENGNTGPSDVNVFKLARIFGVSPSEFGDDYAELVA